MGIGSSLKRLKGHILKMTGIAGSNVPRWMCVRPFDFLRESDTCVRLSFFTAPHFVINGRGV